MMRLMILLLALWMLFPLPVMANDAQEGPDAYAVRGVKPNDVLNVRILPDYQSQKVGEIPFNGKGIINQHCVNDVPLSMWLELSEKERENINQKRWCKIEYQGVTGWVSARYLKEDLGEVETDVVQAVDISTSADISTKPSSANSDAADNADNDETAKLKESYTTYLQLKVMEELSQKGTVYGLINYTDMQQAKSSMGYIEKGFKKRHPEIDTDTIWQEVNKQRDEQVFLVRILLGGEQHASGDAVLFKTGLLINLKEREDFYRALNGDPFKIKKDF